MTTREDALWQALHNIATWPDTGTRYGQKNIKRFAREQLAYAASLDSSSTTKPARRARKTEGETA